MIARRLRRFAILCVMDMDERPNPPPWGVLIAEALKESGLSARKAAGKVPISEGRWRQIVTGYQNVSAGVYAPVRGPAETLARMARVVGVTPEQLDEAGREDAAEALRDLHSSESAEEPRKDPEKMIADGMALIAEAQEIRRRRDAG